MRRTSYFVFAFLILSLSALVVQAAPYFTYQRSLLPADSTENVGTSTAPWDLGFFNTICLSGDCQSAWPSGGSGFSTTSADYWKTVRDFFSTTSANYWLTQKTTSNLSEGSNLYYTDARVNAYIHASTTIPKTYTANSFSALQTFTAGITSNALTVGTLNGPLQANNGVVSATTSVGVLYGGTGLTSAPAYGNILVGNSSGGYTLTATSSLGLLSSAVTSIGPAGQLQSGPAVTIASSTTGTDFTVTATGNTITYNLPSASASARGLLTSSDWSLFNNKISSTSLDTSAELAALLTDETGSGLAVFGTNPSFAAIDGSLEGAQLNLAGAGSNDSWGMDVYSQQLRFITNSANTNQVQIFNSGAGTTGLYVEGSVGIGTTSPSSKLGLGAATGDRLALWEDGTNRYGFGIATNLLQTYVPNSSSDIGFGTGNSASFTQLFTIKGSGNVGVGTMGPGEKLDIQSATAGSDVTARIYHSDNTNTGSHANLYLLSGGSSGGDPYATFNVNGSEAFSVGIDNSDSDKFKISDSTTLGTNDRLVIDSTGNVGIGTTAPGAKLTIDTGFVRTDGSAAYGLQLYRSGTAIGSITSASNMLSLNDIVGNGIQFLNSSGVANLTLLNTGNVGIGTTTPYATSATINGMDLYVGDSANNSRRLYLTRNGSILGGITADNSVFSLFGGSTPTPHLTIVSSGNVGIGTTTPAGKLDVYGNLYSSNYYSQAAAFRTGYSNGDAGIDLYGSAGQLIIFNTANTERMRLTSAGNLGIGDASPASLFTVGSGDLFQVNSSGAIVALAGISGATGTYDFSGTTFRLPYSASPTVSTNGDIGVDSTSNQVKYQSGSATRVLGNGNFYPSFSYSTSTAWAGTTTIPLGPAFVGETWNAVQCFTDTGTVQVSFNDGTNRMNWMNASTTVGTVTLSSNNTFTAAEKRYVDIGTPASSPTKVACTVSKSLTAD